MKRLLAVLLLLSARAAFAVDGQALINQASVYGRGRVSVQDHATGKLQT